MKKRIIGALAIVTVSLTASAPWTVEQYNLDPSQTQISFVVRHLGVTDVRGKFNKFDGDIFFDESDITKSAVRVVIETASLDTDNERRDKHLRSEDFFEVAKFPAMTFVSKRIEQQNGKLVLHGDLTIRDVTREVAIPFELTGPVKMASGQKRLGAEGQLTINRFDYGLKYNKFAEAIAVVAPEVRIELNVAALTPRQPVAQ